MNKLLRNVGSSFVIKVFGGLIVFPMSVLLARNLTVEDFGKYSFALSIIGIMNYLACLGQDQALVKNSNIFTNKKPSEVYQVMYAVIITLLMSIVLLILYYLCSSFNLVPVVYLDVLNYVFFLLPFFVMRRVYVAALRCRGMPIKAIIPESVVYPLVLIFLIFIALSFFDTFEAETVMFFVLISYITSFIFIVFFYYQSELQIPNLRSFYSFYEFKRVLLIGVPFCLLSLTEGISMFADKIFVGLLISEKELAYYQVASRLTEFALFFESAFLLVFLPLISKAYSINRSKFEKLIFVQTISLFLYCSTFFLVMYFWGNELLNIFGGSYVSALNSLLILMFGYLIASFFGQSTYICTVTNLEKQAIVIMCFSVLINIILLYILIPNYGLEGAALSKSITEIIKKALASYLLYYKIKCNSTVLNFKVIIYLIRRVSERKD
ncbi:oligosaccharide flippase family protein [Pseudoalteromonas sp. CR1]|uniref:oligosaccharide flippase family protein n=1 Tax=Pseudoalteromonas sp. CR1 TaxID=2861964 RepID=UPI001C5F369E|nr:oligosaccharide flippase family protein [Pseudoalteromonas sp. CR1]MBW4966826.1 oligosaccharide flippase family protein [Pseudoalteromonas sp. CR1]